MKFLIILFLVVFYNSCTAQASAIENNEKLNISFYHLDSLRKNFNHYRQLDSTFEKEREIIKLKIDKKVQEFKNYLAKIDQKAKANLLSQNEIIESQKVAQQKQIEIEEMQKVEDANLQNEIALETEKILIEVENLSRSFCVKNNIDILLVYERGGQYGFINPEFDVSTSFIQYLNENHKN